MSKKKTTSLPHSFSHYGEAYSVCKATIKRWHDKGIDVTDPKAVSKYRAQKNHGGARSRGENKVEAAVLTQKLGATTKELGAAAALERLEEAERSAYEHWELAMVGGDPFTVKVARESWLKMTESLRRYDASIEEARRQAGATLAKEEAERILKALAYFMRMAGRQLIIGEVKGFCAEEDPAVLCHDLESLLGEQIMLAVASLVATSEGKLQVPKWVADALNDDLAAFFSDAQYQMEARSEALGHVIKKIGQNKN